MKLKRMAVIVGVLVVGLGVLGWQMLGNRRAIPFEGPSGEVAWAPPVPGLELHVFETGRMVIPGWSAALGGSGERVMDQPAYLIRHPTQGLVMFEAGHHSDIAKDPGAHLGWIHAAGLMPMEQQAGQDARSQLRSAGMDPDSVRSIVVSHFHPEHVGAVEEFPRAEVLADAREIAHGKSHPDYNYVPREYDGVPRWKALALASTPRFGSFEGALNLFGDGSVWILSTPGHTPGHVSVAVNLPAGPVLLTGDVAWSELNIESQSIGLPFVSHDGEAARVSLGRLLSFARDNPRVLIVPGHDLAPLRRVSRDDIRLHPWAWKFTQHGAN